MRCETLNVKGKIAFYHQLSTINCQPIVLHEQRTTINEQREVLKGDVQGERTTENGGRET
ncbi:MAG: hypothetical protein AB7S50_03715 [Bacteroidales bacterium]